MTTITKGWPPSRRKKQAAHIRRTQPWLKTTGPKTIEGKARSSRNAYKHGFRTPAYDGLRRLLRWQRHAVRAVLAGRGIPAPSLTPLSFHNINKSFDFYRLNPLKPTGRP